MAQRRGDRTFEQKAQPVRREPPRWLQPLFFVLLLGLAAALWFGRDQVSAVVAGIRGVEPNRGETARAADRGVPVVVAKADELGNDVIVGAIGTGRARRSVMLFPEATGEIEHMFVAAGAAVKQGDPILRLDSRAAELAVRVARTRLIEAERLSRRAEQLLQKSIRSQASVDDARNVVDRAEFELQQAEEALADREMRAPFDGVVGIPRVEPGDRVTAATEILTLDDRSRLIVEFEVAELYLSRLKTGLKVTARTPSFRDRVFEGVIEHIDSRVDPTSRTVKVRAGIPNREDLLRPGMSFVVDLTIRGKTYPTVHELALQWRKGVSYVWRIRDGKAEKVVVRSVKRLHHTILIEGDIAKGDLVVVEGVHRLRPGRRVHFAVPKSAPSG